MTPKPLGIKNVVSVSGGKDSTALLLLALERKTPNLSAVFADTGHEHELTYAYIEYLQSKTIPIRRVVASFADDLEKKRASLVERWTAVGKSADEIKAADEALKPTGIPFLDLALLKQRFPSPMARFCSEQLKRDAIFEQVYIPALDAGYLVRSWQGVRADESLHRSKMKETEVIAPGLQAYRPLLDWTAADVFKMHRDHGIDPNPLYKLGMSRVGCMPCIHATKADLREIASRFPQHIAKVAKWEKLVSIVSQRGSATFFEVDDSSGTAETQGIYNRVDHARTAHGGKSYDMTSIDAPSPCSSQYGLCE